MKHAFTVDVEDYYHVSSCDRVVQRRKWAWFDSRIVPSTYRVLELCRQSQTRGTFFILGWIADRHPELIRAIDREGHEIGCHSYWHRLIYRQTPAEFVADLRRCRNLLEDLIGRPVRCFRAPSFSITTRSLWAIDCLIQEGFRIDSSIQPVRHDRYGIPAAPEGIYRLATAAGEMVEFSPPVARLGPVRLPLGGGGYLRLYPFRFLARRLRQRQAQSRPFIIYVHPWELDVQQPYVHRDLLGCFRHYHNLGRTRSRLRRLLRRFPMTTLSDAVQSAADAAPLPCLDLTTWPGAAAGRVPDSFPGRAWERGTASPSPA
jgi:polysaccharide deacetylase family protein (PEP-CTERM system associated)